MRSRISPICTLSQNRYGACPAVLSPKQCFVGSRFSEVSLTDSCGLLAGGPASGRLAGGRASGWRAGGGSWRAGGGSPPQPPGAATLSRPAWKCPTLLPPNPWNSPPSLALNPNFFVVLRFCSRMRVVFSSARPTRFFEGGPPGLTSGVPPSLLFPSLVFVMLRFCSRRPAAANFCVTSA